LFYVIKYVNVFSRVKNMLRIVKYWFAKDNP